jgi:hypothetical protein
MPVSVNRTLGPNDRCSLGGAVISAFLCAVVKGDTIVGWTENSGFMVREVGVDGTLAPLDLTLLALASEARNLAFANRIPGISLQPRGKQPSSVLRYRYLTSFKVTLLLELCSMTAKREEERWAERVCSAR